MKKEDKDLGMIRTLIPNYDEERRELRETATAGFVLGLGMTWKGAEYLVSEFPVEWKNIYERKNLYLGDPILIWHGTRNGYRRWSEVKIPDINRVLPQATQFGLVYGAVFATKSPKGRCFLSVSRSDRELTDDELAAVNTKFQSWVQLVMGTVDLTNGELGVLRCFRDGLGQREAAGELGISESTVKKHASRAQEKLGAKSRTQAVAIALTRNYLE